MKKLFLYILFFIPSCLLAEDSIKSFDSEDVIVSANKRVQNVQDVPISVSVIKSEQINMSGLSSLENVLEYIPGIKVNRDNVSLRGSSGFTYGVGSRVAILLDGFPLLTGDNGDVRFDALPLFATSRIEVIKGSGSALYGTSAIGGVINLISHDSKEEKVKMRIFSGAYPQPTYDEWKYSDRAQTKSGFDFMISNRVNKFSYLFNGSANFDESYRRYDNRRNLNLLLKTNYKYSENSDISLFTSLSSGVREDWPFWNNINSAFIPAEGTNEEININSNNYLAFIKLKNRFGTKAFSELKAGIFARHFENNWPKESEEFRNSIATNYNLEYQFNYFLSEKYFLTAGIDLRNSVVNSETFGDRYQSLLAAYTQFEYTGSDKLILNAGVRLDREQTKSIDPRLQLSPKLGLNFKITNDFHLRASAGGGFRAPQIAERFSNISFQGFRVEENPDLIAESSWSAEIGTNYKFEIGDLIFDLDIALFQNHMREMIEPLFDENNLRIKFVNLSEARIRGTEIQINSFLKYFFFQQAFQIMAPWDLTSDQILKYRSKYIAKSMLMIPIKSFNLQFNYRYFSKMERIDDLLAIQVADSDKLNNAHVVDTRLNYNFSLWGSDTQASFFVNNLFNYYYTQMVGNMAPTRYIGLQFTVSK